MYTAHWDHLGKDENLKGDQIYNGAADNASGVAMMLESRQGVLARMYNKPPRSIVFLAVTAEEKGLARCAKYYAENPLVSPRFHARRHQHGCYQPLGRKTSRPDQRGQG